MSRRSSYKGWFLSKKLVRSFKTENDKKMYRFHSRSLRVHPSFVKEKIGVYNGKRFFYFVVEKNHVGHKIGECSFTRSFTEHSSKRNIKRKR